MSNQHGFLELGACRLAYRSDGDGPPLLFVHAGIADGRMWEPQRETFSGGHRVIRPDLRGFGATAKPDEPYASHEDLASLLEHLDVERAAVVGASMGGGAAIDLCLTHPERVGALVLVGSALGGHDCADPWLERKWEEAAAAFEAGDHETAARVELETWLAGPDRELDQVDPDVVARMREMLLRSYELDAEAGELALAPPAAERLAEIHVPTLVVVGAGDVAGMHRIAERLVAEIPGAESVVIPDAAHLPSLERPEAFDPILSAFLGRIA